MPMQAADKRNSLFLLESGWLVGKMGEIRYILSIALTCSDKRSHKKGMRFVKMWRINSKIDLFWYIEYVTL